MTIAEIFLICALALPPAPKVDYIFLKEYIEQRWPTRTLVFINDAETLLTHGAKKEPLWSEDLRLWTIPRYPVVRGGKESA